MEVLVVDLIKLVLLISGMVRLSGCSNLNEKIDDIALVDGRGIFMEVLINLLDEYGLEIPVYGLNESNLKESSLDILSKL